MGAFCIALFVTRWNQWSDLEAKKNLRKKLYPSGGSTEINNVIKELEAMTLKSLAWQVASYNIFHHHISSNTFIGTMSILFTSQPRNAEETRTFYRDIQEKVDLAEDEIALYFTTMFNEGHLEQIPLPDFFYSPKEIVVERRIMSPEGKMSVAGPKRA